MSNPATAGAGRNAPLFAWLGPLAGLAELGTEGYPRPARRQMAIVNLMAVLIAVFSAIYAIVFAFYGMDIYLHLIVVNLLLVAVALLVPFAHRISDIAGALLIAIAEFAALSTTAILCAGVPREAKMARCWGVQVTTWSANARLRCSIHASILTAGWLAEAPYFVQNSSGVHSCMSSTSRAPASLPGAAANIRKSGSELTCTTS